MITFKKYSSIENSYSREFMERVRAEMPPDLMWVVQEKVHGANTSFLCDGVEVKFAKRTAMLAPDEQFFNYEETLNNYRERVMALTAEVMAANADVKSVSVFGELFGGKYPHPDVEPSHKLSLIQKGVFYCPGHEFYGFDIYLATDDGGRFLDVHETNALFEKHGFFYAKTLMKGSLDECLAYPNAFESKITGWLGLPPIGDNICEGMVIRPIEPMYLRNGSRVLIKNKNARFAEKKLQKRRTQLFAEPVPYSDALKALVAEAEAYVTEQRLANVVSHIGEVHVPKDFGKIMGLFTKDALDDFLKEHGSAYAALEKSEQKLLNKELNKLATALVKQVYMSQAYITE